MVLSRGMSNNNCNRDSPDNAAILYGAMVGVGFLLKKKQIVPSMLCKISIFSD